MNYHIIMELSYVCVLLIIFAIRTSEAAAVRQAVSRTASSILNNRADINLTQIINATSILRNLDFTSNCSLSLLWYNNLPSNGAGAGNDTLNIQFLRSALPTEYQDENDDQITSLYSDMSVGSLSAVGWLGIAQDDIEVACVAPQFESQISLSNLNATQNCTATSIFLSSIGWITSIQNYTASNSNNTLWLDFVRASIPAKDQSNFTNLELLVYLNFLLRSENTTAISEFLTGAFDNCQKDICHVQGYTGNPDIGGIGVMSSYTVEVVLVNYYFVGINFQIWMQGVKGNLPPRITRALSKAQYLILNGALFFSISISTAGWVSIVLSSSYYEKLMFTSANVVGLSALFAFFGMFTERRGIKELSLLTMIGGILFVSIDSVVQYIVYLKEPNEKYHDYACLHAQLQKEGAHPALFIKALFLLLGFIVFLVIIGIFLYLRFWLPMRPAVESVRSEATVHLPTRRNDIGLEKIDLWILAARLFIQVVALVVMWAELTYLWKVRAIMARVAGDTWLEGQWGFGQVLALFVWLPTIIDILGCLLLPEKMIGITG